MATKELRIRGIESETLNQLELIAGQNGFKTTTEFMKDVIKTIVMEGMFDTKIQNEVLSKLSGFQEIYQQSESTTQGLLENLITMLECEMED